MSFLESYILLAMPLAGLPILIHLVNRRRYRSISWGAMQFVLQAQRQSTAIAKLRHLLILLSRMLAIAALLFVLSRPLATGWLGLSVGRPAETVIVILDRSASMEQRHSLTGMSKRETAIARIDDMLHTTGKNSRVVLIENTKSSPIELGDSTLADLPDVEATATSADLPAQMQAALEYVANNQTGRTDIWVCSDLQAGDWDAQGGRWKGLRDEFKKHPGVQFVFLSYDTPVEDNLSVQITNLRRREVDGKAELAMDLHIKQTGTEPHDQKVALAFVINGTRSRSEIDLLDGEFFAQGFSLPIDIAETEGVGYVELPADANLCDNTFYFTFAEPPVRRTVVVSDDEYVGRLLKLTAEVQVDSSTQTTAQWFKSSQIGEINWDDTAMILWHAPIPDETLRGQLESFVAQGRCVIMLPPTTNRAGAEGLASNGGIPVSVSPEARFFQTGWRDSWNTEESDVSVLDWRAEVDLLANTETGPLPVGDLSVRKYHPLHTDNATVLATLENGKPLLVRAITEAGASYFLATVPIRPYSTFTQDQGLVLYIMIQRALEAAVDSVGSARQLTVGTSAVPKLDHWTSREYRDKETLLSQRAFQNGAYEKEGRLVAINRPLSEDSTETVTQDELSGLMGSLSYQVIRDQTNEKKSFFNEIWQIFQVGMIIGLIAEALLCLPSKEKS